MTSSSPVETFEPSQYTEFVYRGLRRAERGWEFHFRLDGPAPLDFTEVFQDPESLPVPGSAVAAAELAIGRLLYLAVGISYYKAAAPAVVRLPGAWTEYELQFLRDLIAGGLGEFAYVNDLPSALRPRIVADDVRDAAPVEVPLQSHLALTPVGGGKDSCVSLAALNERAIGQTAFAVNGHRSISAVAGRAHVPLLVTRRSLDPLLLSLNAAGALNGHVPVTAINSLSAVLVAIRLGASNVVMSNERSASEPNTIWSGVEVNHQWSKSLEAESLIRRSVAASVGDLEYFSILRPYSELRIAERFARLEQFHDVFTSCGRAFVANSGVDRWCLNCAKCRFVGVIMAPYLGPGGLRAIFGADVFAGPTRPFLELAGMVGHKPLECVGEVLETRLAMHLAARRPDWAETNYPATILAEIPQAAMPTATEARELMGCSESHFCPPMFEGILEDD